MPAAARLPRSSRTSASSSSTTCRPSWSADVVRLVDEKQGVDQPVAAVVDVRAGVFFDSLREQLAEEFPTRRTTLLFLEAADDILVRRQEAARRPHPLQGSGRLLEGITREREVMAACAATPTWSSTPPRSTCTSSRTRSRGRSAPPRRCGCGSRWSASGSSTACRSTPTCWPTCGSCRTRTGCPSCVPGPARTPTWRRTSRTGRTPRSSSSATCRSSRPSATATCGRASGS